MSQISSGSETLSTEKIAEIKKAVEKLSSNKQEEKQAAQAELERLGANKMEVLLALLKKEAEDRRKRHRYVGIGVAAYLLLALSLLIVPMLFGGKPITDLFKHELGGMIGLIFVMLAFTSAQKNATRELKEFEDKRVVGAWAAALEYDDKEIVATAKEKLIQLLPQLNASDADLLDKEQRANLYKALNQPPNKKKNETTVLHEAILTVLQQIGDEEALPHVEKLAKGEGRVGQYQIVREKAHECLPYLEKRVAQIRASQTLLRPSSAMDASLSGSDVLLRPATYSGETAPQELLRAANVEASEAQEGQRENTGQPVPTASTPDILFVSQGGTQ